MHVTPFPWTGEQGSEKGFTLRLGSSVLTRSFSVFGLCGTNWPVWHTQILTVCFFSSWILVALLLFFRHMSERSRTQGLGIHFPQATDFFDYIKIFNYVWQKSIRQVNKEKQ